MTDSMTTDDRRGLFELPSGVLFGWWCELRSEKTGSLANRTRYKANFATSEEAKVSLADHIQEVSRNQEILLVVDSGLLLHFVNTDPEETGLRIEL